MPPRTRSAPRKKAVPEASPIDPFAVTEVDELGTELAEERTLTDRLQAENEELRAQVADLTQKLATAGPVKAQLCAVHYPGGWDAIDKGIAGVTCDCPSTPVGGWTRPEILEASRQMEAANRNDAPHQVSPVEAAHAGTIDTDPEDWI